MIVFSFFTGLSIKSYGQNNQFTVFAVTDLKRVFEDGYNLPEKLEKIELIGIRNEFISGQFVINATNNLTNVTVESGNLKNEQSGDIIPADMVKWNFVGSIPLSSNTPNQPVSVLERIAPADYPDYLMAETHLNIQKGEYRSVWLTILIPENSDEGIYSGKLTVKSEQGEQSVPIRVKVYPLILPDERNLKVTEWYNTRHFPDMHGIDTPYSDDWFAMLKKYAVNMAEHRQNVFQVPASVIGISKSSEGILEFDFTRFDQIAEVFWSTGKMDYLETGELFRFGEEGWSGTEIFPRNFSVRDAKTGEQITLEGDEVLPHLLQNLESHLRQKGWLNKSYFHVKDEPSLHNAEAWRKASAYVNKYAPDLIRMDAIETTYLLDDIEVAVPKLDAFATWYDTYREGLKKGTELWLYTVGIYQGSLLPNKTIDMPLIDCRLMHWLNYKYDATGYLHWGWNQWTDDPFKEVGMHIGDGWHVYPARDGVLNSLRWELMRNGIQDYEIFIMLEKKISALKDSLGTKFSWIDPEQRGKEICGKVVKGFVERSNDPKVFYNARAEVIEELMNFNSSPGVYIQTDPVEGSALTSRSSVEVYGWTEPGTTILLNDKELPVSREGIFLEKIMLTDKQPDIKIKATNVDGSKEIIRRFMVH